MKVLVTGGAGYLGTALVPALAARTGVDEVIVYDNLSRGNYNLFISHSQRMGDGRVRFEQADLLDSRRLAEIVAGVDVVYHLAARATTPFSDLDAHFFEQTNNWGTAELVYAVESSGRAQRLIYTSSASVYGSVDEPADERTPPNPQAFYSASKRRGEEHVQRLSDTLDTTIVRLGTLYGYSPGIRFDTVVNRFAFDAQFHGRVTIHGSGHQQRPFLHVDHAVAALLSLLDESAPTGITNLCDRNLSVLEIVDALQAVRPGLEFIFINQHLRMRELRMDPDTALARHAGLVPSDFGRELGEFQDRFAFRPPG